MKIGMKCRNEVLSASLLIESMTSKFIAGLLDIKDIENSKVLGNKGGCLAFNQKIDLLIEMGALSNEVRSKFYAFMEIRNQFMHNISADTYEKCFSFTGGTDIFILKKYPQPSTLSKEEALRASTQALINDIGQLTVSIIKKIEDKIRKEIELDILKKSEKAAYKSIAQIKDALNEFFQEKIEGNEMLEAARLKDFGTDISKLIYELWLTNLKKMIDAGDTN